MSHRFHYYEGYWERAGRKRFYVTDRRAKLPVALSHEILGNITKAGPDARDQPVGVHRIVFPWLGYVSCRRCAWEEDNKCGYQQSLRIHQNGGFASYVLVPDPRYLVDAGSVDPAIDCTFGCSGITTFSAISKVMPLDPEEPVVLVGAGGLGSAGIAMVGAVGHKNIVDADINDEKLEKTGARVVINGGKAGAGKAI